MAKLCNQSRFRVPVYLGSKAKISGAFRSDFSGKVQFLIGVHLISSGEATSRGFALDVDGKNWVVNYSVNEGVLKNFSIEFKIKNSVRDIEVSIRAGGGLELFVKEWDTAGSVFVIGGCVSRDAFELYGAPPLAGYRARSSLVAAFDKTFPRGITEDTLQVNKSSFQRNMLWAELSRSLPKTLEDNYFDYILIDFIIERTSLGLIDAALVTRSPEFIKTGLDSFLDGRFDNTSAEYFELFEAAWKELCLIVGESRIIVNKVFWAENDEVGNKTADSQYIKRQNERLQILYDIVKKISPNIHWLQYDTTLVADPNHKWGVAPYHYGKMFYQELIQGLREVQLTPSIGALNSEKSTRTGETVFVPRPQDLNIRLDFEIAKELEQLSINLEFHCGKSVVPKNMLLSFDLKFTEGAVVKPETSVADLVYSDNPNIGWYVYIPTNCGDNQWKRDFSFGNGIICTGLSLVKWNDRSTEIKIKSVEVFPIQ